ncbi:Kidins220 [Symbiodinium sp. CCMP2592]|nr:Kidins220 [Symbiodinium sp. CCMP2592]
MAGKGGEAPANPPSNLARELTQAHQQLGLQQNITSQPVYTANQQLWFQHRQDKRKAPSASGSMLGTPQVPESDATMDEMGPDPFAQATPPDAGQGANLFQPMPMQESTAYSLAAAQLGVDINDPAAVQSWLSGTVSTRAEVLQTVRAYHHGVIRPELFHYISQVENVVKTLDDRIAQNQEGLRWLASENRAQQKRECGLMVILSGWDQSMTPGERLYMINWLLGQVTYVRHFLQQRSYNPSDSAEYYYLGALQTDPSTPPAGTGKWSTVTTLYFKSWDLRKEFMAAFGGSGGTPLWKDSQTVAKGFHIRATPASPQFQRKLELPVRVLLKAMNKWAETQTNPPTQMIILWRTLTVMEPSENREWNEQIRAAARMIYFEKDGVFQGRLEITRDVHTIIQSKLSKPPPPALEDTLWEHCWSEVAYGIQLEMDKADKEIFERALRESKGSGKGVQLGKSSRHWSTPLIHSSDSNPFPIPMYVMPVDDIAFSWDELCDKQNQPDQKQHAASPPSTIPAGAKGKGKGKKGPAGTEVEDDL